MPSVEPFVMDQLSLQLTGGPQGYRINLKNMQVFGASNFTVKTIKWEESLDLNLLQLSNPIHIYFRLSEGNKPFEARLTIPKLLIHAKYTSSGVLIIIPASGAGDFDAVFGRGSTDLNM